MSFKGQAIAATEASIAVIASELGVPFFRLRGVIEVEAPMGAFDDAGRPAMLFEPHKFHALLRGTERENAERAGLAYERWGAKPYPRDSYPRLERAMTINRTAALKACSWGRGQVLGENHALAGYPSVEAMVEAFKRSESEQLRGMATFIRKSGLLGHLKAGRAAAFARGYNGPGYAKHGYDTRIAAAWRKWQGRPAPEVAGEVPETAAPPATVAVTKEGAAAIGGGALVVLETATTVGKSIQDASTTATGLVDALANPRVLGLVALALIFLGIWYWRRRRIAEEGV